VKNQTATTTRDMLARNATKTTKKKTSSFLSVSIQAQQLGTDWKIIPDQDFWRANSGSSYISLKKRYTYPKTFLEQTPYGLIFGYINPADYKLIIDCRTFRSLATLIGKLVAHGTEINVGVLDTKQKSFHFFRDTYCNLPLFVRTKENQLVLDNEFRELFDQTSDQPPIDSEELAIKLLVLPSYSNKTIFKDISQLSERSILVMAENSLCKITLPENSPLSYKPSNPQNFDRVLETSILSIYTRVSMSAKVGIELSGGLDSSTVAGVISDNCETKLPTFTTRFIKQEGVSQQQKLDLLAKRFHLQPHLLDSSDKYPLSEVDINHLAPDYYRTDIYEQILSELAKFARTKGIEVIFTGIGGDELFMIDKGERANFSNKEFKQQTMPSELPPFLKKEKFKKLLTSWVNSSSEFPTPALPFSTYRANTATNNIFIREGIWPIAPLVNTSLVKYCRGLEKETRKRKGILRLYQEKHNYPIEVYNPDVNESFRSIFLDTFARRSDKIVREIMDKSVLAKKGWLDSREYLIEYKKFKSGDSEIRPIILYGIVRIEILLQALGQIGE